MAFGNATKGYVKKHSGGGGGGGTSNYNDLSNKPSINGVTLTGNKTSEDLNIGDINIEYTPVVIVSNEFTFNINDVNLGIKLVVKYANSASNIIIYPFISKIDLLTVESGGNLNLKYGSDTCTISVTKNNDNYKLFIRQPITNHTYIPYLF